MYWFNCSNCYKLSRSNNNFIICKCGEIVTNKEKLLIYEFEGEELILEIPPNKHGKFYKNNKKFDEEMRKYVMNYGRE